jgi:hypothetical protein
MSAEASQTQGARRLTTVSLGAPLLFLANDLQNR